jgi:polysaccharide biosynthesis protein PslF
MTTYETGISFGVVTTYPPTKCGIANFSRSLVGSLAPPGSAHDVSVVRLVDDPDGDRSPEAAHELVRDADDSTRIAAKVLDQCDVALVQHEFGIYGGPDGEEVVDLVDTLTVPRILIIHTVKDAPTERQRGILERVCATAERVVTLSKSAHRRLLSRYEVDPGKTVDIPHGVQPNTDGPAGSPDGEPTILTWGLLRPGKGLEWAVEAMGLLSDLGARYVIAGQTHPKVVERDGEAYREELAARAEELGADVVFDDRFFDGESLKQLVRSCDVVLLPYITLDQVTSGVLVDALASGRPVVSTPFPHAVELLSGGAGLLVAERDPQATADALRRVLTDQALAESMQKEAGRLARSFAWPAVAARFRSVAAQVLDEKASQSG